MFNIWFLLTLLLDTVPATVMHYLMLKEALRFSFFKSMVVSAAVILAYDLGICYLFFNGYITTQFSVYLRMMIFIVLMIMKFWLIPGYAFQNAYIVSLVLPYVISGIVISAFFISFIDIDNTPPYMVMTILRFAFTISTIHPIYDLWKKQIIPAINIKDKRIWWLAIGIQFFLDIGFCINLSPDYAVNGIEMRNLINLMLLIVVSMFTTTFLFFAINVARSYTRIEEYSKQEKMLLMLQEQQYEALSAQIEQARRSRHDLRHHVSLVQELLEEGKYQEAKLYLKEYTHQVPASKTKIYCVDYAVNALINHYVENAEKENIETKIKCEALADFKGNSTDMCIVLGNAFENAIEACKQVEDIQKRFINISANSMAGQLFLVIDNSYSGDLYMDNEKFLSSKRGFKSSGYGMSSIATVVNKYGGRVHTDEKGNVFSLSVMMKIM